MRYFLVGPVPPPLGGVSVFIERYARHLRSLGRRVTVLDLPRRGKFERLIAAIMLVVRPRAVIHLNYVDSLLMLAILCCPVKHHVIFHDHNMGRFFESLSRIRRLVLRLFLRRVQECWLVTESLAACYERHGLRLPNCVRIKPAFLPPTLSEEPKIRATYGPEIDRFVSARQPLLLANASRITFHNGNDLYGLDMCVRLLNRLQRAYPRIGLLIALAEVGHEDYFRQLQFSIKESGIEQNVHFMTSQKELWPLIKDADLLIRPTATDGYSVSVAEAIHLGCPAVASDVATRAEGTVLFRNRDDNDLLLKVRQLLQQTEYHPELKRAA